jgi:hypothetical protein
VLTITLLPEHPSGQDLSEVSDMSVEDDLSAAGHAVDSLQQAITALGAAYGENVDLHRLKEDVSRVCTDLRLLRESRPDLLRPSGPPEPASAPAGDYDPAFWADAEDEDQVAAGGRPTH